ncbi:MAG: 3-dehydroquinate synthase [Christensenellales bacterium]|jgi:3-dehydroquinate synthase
MTHRVSINTKNSYDVFIGSGLLKDCGGIIRSKVGLCRTAVVTDSAVEKLYLPKVEESLRQAGFEVCAFSFPAGEGSKNMATLSELLEFLANNQLTRTDCVVALGGGVVGDLAGFAAGCYLRGVRFVQLPTTLLAAVDSSVGGKTAIDLSAGKNLAGVFHQPSTVICDTDCLNTLPDEIFACGVAEAIKAGILDGEALFSLLETGGAKENIANIIARCVAFKAKVVEKDEFETGIRKTLNLGHTVGHAIETCSGYTIPHGQAVAMGMAVIARSAVSQGLCSRETARRILNALQKNGLPAITRFSSKELADAALKDKKRAGGAITLVMPREIGNCTLETLPIDRLQPIIEAGLEGIT